VRKGLAESCTSNVYDRITPDGIGASCGDRADGPLCSRWRGLNIYYRERESGAGLFECGRLDDGGKRIRVGIVRRRENRYDPKQQDDFQTAFHRTSQQAIRMPERGGIKRKALAAKQQLRLLFIK
jgi:hypothetical protein